MKAALLALAYGIAGPAVAQTALPLKHAAEPTKPGAEEVTTTDE